MQFLVDSSVIGWRCL